MDYGGSIADSAVSGAEMRYFVNGGAMGLLWHLLRKSVCGWILLSCIWLRMMLDTKISTWFLTLISNENNTVCLMCTDGFWLHDILVATHFCSFWLNWAYDCIDGAVVVDASLVTSGYSHSKILSTQLPCYGKHTVIDVKIIADFTKDKYATSGLPWQ